jgi:ArsR family transcriptional regulator, arsenate/arsenite/antimonite-responsive transcriptional repressor
MYIHDGGTMTGRRTKATDDAKPAGERPCCSGLASVVPARLFKALCDPNRIAILARLAECGRPCSVSEVSQCCPVDLSVVSRHLTILRDAGAVESRKLGKEVQYVVRTDWLVATLRALADALESCCPAAADESTGEPPGSTHAGMKGNKRHGRE